MYNLPLFVTLIFGFIRRDSVVGGFSSFAVSRSSHNQRRLRCSTGRHLSQLRCSYVSNAANSVACVTHSSFATALRSDGAVGVLENTNFAFTNAGIPHRQRPYIVNIRMIGNSSDPIDELEISIPLVSEAVDATNRTDDIKYIDADSDKESSDDVLNYLGGIVSIMPPQTRDLIRRITYNYIYGTNDDIITLQEIASIIEEEHRSRDVPVQILGGSTSINSTNVVVFEADVTKTGEAFDELCSEILSLGALYQLPKEIVLALLSAPIHLPSSRSSSSTVVEYTTSISSSSAIIKCRAAFAAVGWKGVVFPMGLAIRPKTKFRSIWTFSFLRNAYRKNASENFPLPQNESYALKNRNNFLPLSWWHRTKTLRSIAVVAARNAATVRPPQRQLIDRRQYLQSLDAQLRQLSTSSIPTTKVDPIVVASADSVVSASNEVTPSSLSPLVAPGVGVIPSSASATGQFFFPDTEPQWWKTLISRRGLSNSIRTLRRVASQQYSALKRQGRAGLVSYCFFNFLYYSVGIWWQWSRSPISQAFPISDLASPLPQLHQAQFSVLALLLRKFGKIFAYLYAFSQLLKVPKLCTAVGLAPFASKCLEMVKRRFDVKETTATAMLVGFMVVVWVALISIPIFSEYASLQHILYLERQLIQVYGLQPA